MSTTTMTTTQTMTTEAFAKVNLTLEVFGTRADGFHALRSLVLPVTFADTVTVALADEISSDSPYPDDLCVKAARTLRKVVSSCRRAFEPKVPGVRIHVDKRIPAGGGLGGGSADAAATLCLLNDLWGLSLGIETLAAIGASVGSDVPALVLSRAKGLVLMEGRGEVVAPYGVQFQPLNLVLVNPGVFSSTAEVYKNCTSRVTDDPSIVYNMRHALESGDVRAIAAALQNDLEAPAVRLHPEIAAAKRQLAAAGAVGCAMSGSGSTVFGLVPDEAAGRQIAASLAAKGLAAWSARSACPFV